MIYKYIYIIILLILSINFSNANQEYVNCKPCISFINNEYSMLFDILNVTNNAAPVLTCNNVCLKSSNSKTIQKECNSLCNGVGIKEFKRIIIRSNSLDIINMCQQLNVCPYNEKAEIKLINGFSLPLSGPQGTNFSITAEYFISEWLGTSEIDTSIFGPNLKTFLSAELIIEQGDGHWYYNISFPTTNSDDYPIGDYEVEIQICSEGCTSSFHNKTILTTNYIYFSITE